MLKQTLSAITAALNTHLQQSLNNAEDLAVLSGIVNIDGSSAVAAQNKILITQVHVASDLKLRNTRPIGFGPQDMANLGLNLKQRILCSAAFYNENYADGLELLELAMQFFHDSPILTIPAGEGKPEIKLEIVAADLSPAELQRQWMVLGSRYLPSAAYDVIVVG
ncbi:Pvc16 family protein [Mucilaginibacter myungsuensis]|uniref:DUF4255 domain-containing protein n=1 Tax=Mucilaginibacter myungsuensis TaxID=649104 RepID=A0A929L3Y1_9SPHI|nr:Pvc16 family protein [Mucilaginibacter myungsuensis]MBE9664034.1 DUF4255 domain-containing protein [Mucilaginibacter myungsuensis]MDN3601213.1 Pvc16 family protein [Mucilaginibacter myungsuensis]